MRPTAPFSRAVYRIAVERFIGDHLYCSTLAINSSASAADANPGPYIDFFSADRIQKRDDSVLPNTDHMK